jgi:hypothetical protein
MPSNPTSPISRDAWSEHIAKWRASELTRIEYCRQHGLQLNSFVYQINRHHDAQAKKLILIPLKVRATPSVAPSGGDFVLRGPKGWSLTMTSDVSTAWLGDLLGRLS